MAMCSKIVIANQMSEMGFPMIWMTILLIILLLIFLLLITRVYVTANLIYTTDNHWLELRIHVLRICVFRRKVPIGADTSEKGARNISFSNVRNVLKREFHIVKGLGKSVINVLKRVRFHKLVWHTEGGTGDAGSTGLVAGGVWSIKGAIICYLVQHSQMKCKPVIQVVPHFQQPCFYTKVECIASLRIGQAIYALVLMLKNTVIKGESFQPKTEV
ncbi:DUF2953 domain-containing protein [Oceanobacillus picturae]|uniref:DUF2953 domain-containing protein n=1 Tax=Oceanobacillus picturae TaxID=171693 RepID=UPI000E67A5FE|nr:DUF2953 domain-containing protein [Oceanobacillus picturae]RIU89706.1 DUF2953 domain-containing protein [Oceanobacillus picturae]